VEEFNLVDKVISISNVPLFSEMRVQDLITLSMVTGTKRFSRGEVVVREGDPGEALYLVIKGELCVMKGLGTDQEVFLDRIRKNDFFGELALIDRMTRSATVKAESDCHLLVLMEENFTGILREFPSISLNICKILCLRIRALQGRLGHSNTRSPK
jgi:CRP-like cAMP-binding protein